MTLSEHVRSTHSQDGAIVLDIRGGRMFRVSLVGSYMLELVKQGCTESQIADQISGEFRIDRATVVRDLEAFLSHLETHGLIEVRQTEPHATA